MKWGGSAPAAGYRAPSKLSKVRVHSALLPSVRSSKGSVLQTTPFRVPTQGMTSTVRVPAGYRVQPLQFGYSSGSKYR